MAELNYTREIPERGYRFLAGEVRRGRQFPREEVEAALQNYQDVAAQAAASGDWHPWADLFTDDALYVEHHYGVLRGQQNIRNWITSTMQGVVVDMVFPVEFKAIDNDLALIYVPNRYPAPDGGEPYQFVAFTILCYAGDNQWCYEEDIYNALEAQRIQGVYSAAKQAAAGT
jgi:uncharacterized protein (TIGR02246 family)